MTFALQHEQTPAHPPMQEARQFVGGDADWRTEGLLRSAVGCIQAELAGKPDLADEFNRIFDRLCAGRSEA